MRKTTSSSYIFIKRGVFYFSRRIPQDLRGHYKRDRIILSLRTKSQRAAQTRAASLATKLEEDWLTLRWKTSNDPFSRFLRDHTAVVASSSSAPVLTEAAQQYISAKGENRSSTFRQSTERSIGYLVALLGDRPIDTYTRTEANQLRDALAARGLSRSSIRRNLSVIRAVINFISKENGLSEQTAFSGLYLGEDVDQPERKCQPIPNEVIRSIQAECYRLDDEARWLVALISDTGMRLSEAAGLVKDDIVFDPVHPHLVLKAHPWRRLKTRGSERVVPLVGASLWAAKRAVEAASSRFLFPKYTSEKGCNANSASAAMNKWLGPRVPKGCVIHSFRHSMRDRLRAVECPSDIVDRIGGWATFGVGQGYGNGYPLKVLSKWVTKVVADNSKCNATK